MTPLAHASNRLAAPPLGRDSARPTEVDHQARVCCELDEAGAVFPFGRFECDTSLAYRSVVAVGRIRVVADAARKAAFCDALMAKCADPTWARPRTFYPRLDQVTVYAIAIECLSGKEPPLPAPTQRWPAVDRTKSPGARPGAGGRDGSAAASMTGVARLRCAPLPRQGRAPRHRSCSCSNME